MVGAALPGFAQQLLSSNGVDGLQTKRTNSWSHSDEAEMMGQETDREESSLQHRTLQLRLTDSGKELVARSDVAYAALLMNDHDRGIRTLGQSLIDSRTSADLVAIVGPGVTKATEVRMRAQGWRIRRIAVDGVDGDEVCDMESASGSVSTLFFCFCRDSCFDDSCPLYFFVFGCARGPLPGSNVRLRYQRYERHTSGMGCGSYVSSTCNCFSVEVWRCAWDGLGYEVMRREPERRNSQLLRCTRTLCAHPCVCRVFNWRPAYTRIRYLSAGHRLERLLWFKSQPSCASSTAAGCSRARPLLRLR